MASKKYKIESIDMLISNINAERELIGKCPVERAWTGIGYWLKTVEPNYKAIGGIYTSEDGFIGFLEGLMYSMNYHNKDK